MNFHFHRVSSLHPFQLTVDFLRRLRLNSVLLRAKGSFVSFRLVLKVSSNYIFQIFLLKMLTATMNNGVDRHM